MFCMLLVLAKTFCPQTNLPMIIIASLNFTLNLSLSRISPRGQLCFKVELKMACTQFHHFVLAAHHFIPHKPTSHRHPRNCGIVDSDTLQHRSSRPSSSQIS
jgi:hypothetical protein